MRFTLATVVSALAAVVTAHTQPDYSQNPSGNAIIKPGLQQQVPAGQPFTIQWEPSTQGPVSLILLRGPSTNVKPLETIAEQVPNNGHFTWTPSTDLVPDVTHYGMMLVVEGTGQYQYSTQFGISNPDYNGGKHPTASISTATVVTPTTAPTEQGTETVVTTVATTECPESEAPKTVVTTISTTECPETEAPASTIPVSVPASTPSGAAPVNSTPAVPTTMATSSRAVINSSAASTPASSTPAASSSAGPSVPVVTGAASRSGLSLGVVAAGAVAVLAL